MKHVASSRALLATCFTLVSCLAYSSNLTIAATFSSETLFGLQRTTRRYIPEARTPYVYYNLTKATHIVRSSESFPQIVQPRRTKHNLYYSTRRIYSIPLNTGLPVCSEEYKRVKLLSMYFSPLSSYLLSLRSTYLSHHSVLEQPQPTFLP
jgi:hypothetical protein